MSTELALPRSPASALKSVLKIGNANGQDANTLAFLLNTTPRAIRTLVDDLIEAGTPVCAHPRHGYFIAQTQHEVDEAYNFLRTRALHSLKKASMLRNAFLGATNDFDPFNPTEGLLV